MADNRNITRRMALKALPFAGAAVAVPALAATASELPVDRANRLAWELAETMNEYTGGTFHAVVYPSKMTEWAVSFQTNRQPTANSNLLSLIKRHSELMVVYNNDVNKADRLHKDYDPAFVDVISQHETDDDELMMAIATFPALNKADRKAKAEYLITRSDDNHFWVNPELYAALLECMVSEA